jgi:antitoxin (DNA-binding transcriptional repressor) of toxin-antitoxin stability system
MRTIEMQELEEHVSEIIRQASERGETVEVTENGAVRALLVPVNNREPDKDGEMDLEALVAEIGKHLPERVDAVEMIHDIRREL